MLLEGLDHAVDENLTDEGGEGKDEQIAQELWVLEAEDEHGFELVAQDEMDEGEDGRPLVDGDEHLD
jgi:hypothetical protein